MLTVKAVSAMCRLLSLSLCLCLCLCVLSNHGYSSWVPDRTVGQVWPLPQNVSSYTTRVSIDPSHFIIRISNVTCPVLEEAVKRYTDVIKKALPHRHHQECTDVGGGLKEMLVALTGPCEEWPHLGMDEHYELHVNSPDLKDLAVVSSSSVWGLLRGLETFSQLVTPTADSCCLVLNSTDILDYPRFKHRGLLLDTARHYLPVPVIYNILAAMEMNKMNVFHWHIVDDESFPYQSTTYPSLSEKGAYDPKKLVYTQENVKKIIEFARLRGIRVIPEFDSPGHTRSWGKGASKLLTGCYTNGSFNGQFGPVDPTRDQNFKFIRTLLEEVKSVFPDKYIHIGGDEVQFGFDCWMSNPGVLQFMKDKNIMSPEGLESYYMNHILNMVDNINASAIVWEEVFTHGDSIRNNTVVHIWHTNRQQLLNEVTKAGKFALLSEGWYLDHILDQWQNFYMVDPTDFNGTVAQRQLVLGGEACMWGEMVDESNVVPRVWPRASAVAERLWSQAAVNVTVAAPRLNEHVCRMRHRGVAAQPANGPGFCPY